MLYSGNNAIVGISLKAKLQQLKRKDFLIQGINIRKDNKNSEINVLYK